MTIQVVQWSVCRMMHYLNESQLQNLLMHLHMKACQSFSYIAADMPTFGVSKEGDKILELCKEISCILRQP